MNDKKISQFHFELKKIRQKPIISYFDFEIHLSIF
jgi:hypothetical protein